MFTMRFDMRAPGQDATARGALYRAAIDMAAWADSRGSATVVVSEHHASEDGYLPSPFPMAAALAAVTTTTPIVVAAALLPLYDPVRLAEDLIVIDHISGGRAMFVLALGYRPVEYELHGVDFGARGRIADEKLVALLDVLRGASSDEHVAGRHTGTVLAGRAAPRVGWGDEGGGPQSRAQRRRLLRPDRCRRSPGHLRAGRPRRRARAGAVHPPIAERPGVGLRQRRPRPRVGGGRRGAAPGHGAVLPVERGGRQRRLHGQPPRSQTVEDLRKEGGSHRVVTVAEAIDLVRTHGMLSLQPLCGGLDPEVAWRYLRRVVDDVVPGAAAAG